MTREDKAFLIGCILGDGCLRKPIARKNKKVGNVSLLLTHSIKQKEYMLWKVDRIRNILNSNYTAKVRFINNSGYPGICWEKSHKYFRILRKWLYPNNKKQISSMVLNKLTAEAIAVWYMDDGSLTKKKRNGHIHAREATLNTYLSYQDNQVIINYFYQKWDIKMLHNKSKGKYRLRFGGKELWKFVKLIKDHVHPSMSYKIDLQYEREVIKKQYEKFLSN